jgi:hypothetical protein
MLLLFVCTVNSNLPMAQTTCLVLFGRLGVEMAGFGFGAMVLDLYSLAIDNY